MSVRSRLVNWPCAVAVAAALAACSSVSDTPPTSPAPSAALQNASAQGVAMALEHAKVCPSAAPETARCHALVLIDAGGNPNATAGPSGLGPQSLWSAYKLAPTGAPGTGPTIAIIDAYDNPNVEADLQVYRNQFNLGACTTSGR